MLERINLILKSRNLNAAQFADEIGVQRSSVSHILTGRNNASLDFLLKVLSRYPEIDTDWLLIGKGQMMRVTVSNSENKEVEQKQSISTTLTQNSETKSNKADIFQQHTDIQNNLNDDLLNVNEISDEVIKQTETVLEKKMEQKKPDERVSKNTSARLVEKIVFFYSDKTFSEFNPEV